jgi:hypothetical protein
LNINRHTCCKSDKSSYSIAYSVSSDPCRQEKPKKCCQKKPGQNTGEENSPNKHNHWLDGTPCCKSSIIRLSINSNVPLPAVSKIFDINPLSYLSVKDIKSYYFSSLADIYKPIESPPDFSPGLHIIQFIHSFSDPDNPDGLIS